MSTKLCARCGGSYAAHALFCQHCGFQPGAPLKAPGKAGAALSVVAAIALVIAAVGASAPKFGALQLRGNGAKSPVMQTKGDAGQPILPMSAEAEPSALLQESGATEPPVLEQQAEATEPVLVREASSQPTLQQEATGMPSDVRDWLNHLERIERQRMQTAASQLSEAMGMMGIAQDIPSYNEDEEPPVDNRRGQVQSGTGSMRQSWSGLIAQFKSVPPPTQCVGLRNAYSPALEETAGMMLDILDALSQAESDRQGALATLMKMMGQSGARIGGPSKQANGLLGEVCGQYKVQPWFEIKEDIGGGLMGKGMLPGGMSLPKIPGLSDLGLGG